MAEAARRWMKFWPADWHGDKALRTCSVGARGLWIDLICMAHEGTPYGHVTINGKGANNRQIGAVTGISEKEAAKLISELEDAGVFSRTEEGTIYSRRMVKDHKASLEGKAWVEKRYANKEGNGADDKPPPRDPTPPPSRGANGHATGDPNTHEARSQKLEAREESKQPGARIFGGLEECVVQCEGRPSVRGFFLDSTRDQVYEAAGIDPARWQGNERPIIQWMYEGIEPSTIVRAIRRCAERQGYEVPGTLKYFSKPVHEEHKRRPQ